MTELGDAKQQHCTENDYDWSFIKKLPVSESFFDGALRRYDADAAVISHLEVKYVPYWSLHEKNGEHKSDFLIATRKDGLPGLALFANAEPQLPSNALLTAIILLIYTRHYKSRSVVRLERSLSCREGCPPTAKFIREMLRLFPLSGAICFAVFPGRDKTAVVIARLVTYVASFMVSLNFKPFQSEEEFNSWLQITRENMVLPNLKEFDLFSEHNHHLKYFCSQFDTLRTESPGDAECIADLLCPS